MKIKFSAPCCFLGVLILLQSVCYTLNAQDVTFNNKTPKQTIKGEKDHDGDTNLTLRDALLEIKRMCQVDILFEEGILSGITVNSETVRSRLNNAEEALAKLLKDSQLKFRKVKKDTYIIVAANASSKEVKKQISEKMDTDGNASQKDSEQANNEDKESLNCIK